MSVYYCFVLKCQPSDVCELATYPGCTLPLPVPLRLLALDVGWMDFSFFFFLDYKCSYRSLYSVFFFSFFTLIHRGMRTEVWAVVIVKLIVKKENTLFFFFSDD